MTAPRLAPVRRGILRLALGARAPAILFAVYACACGPSEPRIGTQTNWLRSCQSDADCGELTCLCGACTRRCDDEATCSDLPGASCVAAEDPGAIALCGGGTPPSAGLCLPRCPEQGCAAGTACVADVCSPTLEPSALVSVDVSERFQTLVGIGAGVAYLNDEVAQHPRKAELFDAMFSGTGLSVLRLRNSYGQDEDDLGSTQEIVAAATERLGQRPVILLNSASPPGSLKQSGSSWCEGNPETCTLARLDDGSFDYAGLASHWRASLEAYTSAGIEPDYISIQNNPNWVPEQGAAVEACRFLPREGTATVPTAQGDVSVDYPGYREALDAILAELEGLGSVPGIVAPETSSLTQVTEYAAELDFANVDAIAHHLYGVDPADVDPVRVAELEELSAQHQRPLFQSEMQADALATARHLHNSLAIQGAALFIHNGFLASAGRIEPDPTALINLTQEDFVVGDLYHVMLHYSAHTGPGWVRVSAGSDQDDVLASAWVSPESDVFVVILTNPGLTAQAVRIDIDRSSESASSVTRTVLGGTERSAALGAFPPGGVVSLPGQSTVSVVLRQ